MCSFLFRLPLLHTTNMADLPRSAATAALIPPNATRILKCFLCDSEWQILYRHLAKLADDVGQFITANSNISFVPFETGIVRPNNHCIIAINAQ
jgi:hypothetical protein